MAAQPNISERAALELIRLLSVGVESAHAAQVRWIIEALTDVTTEGLNERDQVYVAATIQRMVDGGELELQLLDDEEASDE